MNKQNQDIQKSSRLLEKEWFIKQSELIDIQNENNKMNEEICKCKDLCLIFDQKKIELEENYKNIFEFIKKVNKNITYIRLHLEKFALKNKETIDKIEYIENDLLIWKENINNKNEEHKNKKEYLTSQINHLKKEKENYQQNILNYENQILSLEQEIIDKKKLQQIAKEYLENKDIMQLKKDITNKNNIFDNIKKQQNVILSNIKIALNKRNDLDNKKEFCQKNFDMGKNISFKIQHQIGLIKKSLKSLKNKKENLTNTYNEIIQLYDNLVKDIQQEKNNLDNLNEDYNIYEAIYHILSFEKKHRFQELLKFQNALKYGLNNNSLKNADHKKYTDIKKKCATYKKKISNIKKILQQIERPKDNYIKFIGYIQEWIVH